MRNFRKARWPRFIATTVLAASSGIVSAMPANGCGYSKQYSPARDHHAPFRAFRSHGAYQRQAFQRPFRAYGRHAPYAFNADRFPRRAVHPSYAHPAQPHHQGAGFVAAAQAQAPKDDAAANSDRSVEIANMRFSPAKLTVEAGETVIWTQLANMPHTVTANDGSFDSPTLGQSREFSVTFDKPGSYTYYCKLHPSMIGEIEVL